MIYGATVLRTKSPSIIKLTSGQQPVDHAGQLACGQHQRPLVGVVGSAAIFADVKGFEFRVAHTNPVGRLDQVIPQVGITRPRQRSIIRVERARLMSTPRQTRIFGDRIVGREPAYGPNFGHDARSKYRTDAVDRSDGLRDGGQIAGDRFVQLAHLAFQQANGIQVHDQTELTGFRFFGPQTKGLVGQPLQCLGDVVRRFQRRAADLGNFFGQGGQGRGGQAIGGLWGQHVFRCATKDIGKKGLIAIFGGRPISPPQTEQFIQRAAFFARDSLRQVKTMARDNPQRRVARIGGRRRAQASKPDGIRNQKRIAGIGFRSVDVRFAKSLHNTGIHEKPLGLPSVQPFGLGQRLKQRPVIDRRGFQAHGEPIEFSGLRLHPLDQLLNARSVIGHADACPDLTLSGHGTHDVFCLAHIDANKQGRKHARHLLSRMGCNVFVAIRKGNRSTPTDGLCHLVISRHAPPSCATVPVPTVLSVEGGNPRVSFPSVGRPRSLSRPSAPFRVSLEAGETRGSRPDPIQDHRPGLVEQDKYFQIGLEFRWSPWPGTPPNPMGRAS